MQNNTQTQAPTESPTESDIMTTLKNYSETQILAIEIDKKHQELAQYKLMEAELSTIGNILINKLGGPRTVNTDESLSSQILSFLIYKTEIEIQKLLIDNVKIHINNPISNIDNLNKYINNKQEKISFLKKEYYDIIKHNLIESVRNFIIDFEESVTDDED